MLTDLLLGDYRKKLLSQLLLHPDTDYHVRELARLTGTSPGSLHKELARLAAAGLLLRKAQGNQVRYQANRQCPVFPELAGLLRKTTGAAELLARALAPLQPVLALIFGSVARGTEVAGSDVDVLVVTERGFGEVVRALHSAQTTLGREINPVVYTPAELQGHVAEQDPFVLNLLAGPHIFLNGTSDDLSQLAGHPAPASV
ncbi:MAG: nucleotidyltransferase domain-containing protein [Hydrogenophaga sp.]|jgi:predicted nucleotidyltransferase|uniref:nucleotidyltransferase domain-containing protein n=1 Tax=Hydrogenophaga sp. TaxID=1904254 RepID=UPI0027172280|nr:nucleotidyltransferase domain-containing protein [Hydrogenophaga sp.]MDO9483891.1 nucleotidyltransferase domain-containing protein [Hydrogenophaga sp.]MDO9569687.1 nucleotidyltransferase domain-containing protein [Hydrogenophaga sp.]MDP2095098.1 nucleotidyltransferase domain-containing protein [Hydrogenophaga sp.]MDP2221561.1 nucleotidyltransferase domain-containing protein [Hydrogenophaga sp.]MDP3346420.1 nucleotidyltransferase domain-containing protein [Hydrogenophaga sp.]